MLVPVPVVWIPTLSKDSTSLVFMSYFCLLPLASARPPRCLFRRKDKEKTTTFNGSLITLDFRANMATDMLKFVVQQKINPVELAFKVWMSRARAV